MKNMNFIIKTMIDLLGLWYANHAYFLQIGILTFWVSLTFFCKAGEKMSSFNNNTM